MRQQILGFLATISVVVAVASLLPAMALPYDTACPNCPTSNLYQSDRSDRLADIPLRMWTDKKLYLYGSDIIVEGAVANYKPDIPVTMTIYNPQNNVIGIQQIHVNADNTYKVPIKADGNLWNKDGFYTIRVQYGPQEIHDREIIEIVGSPGTPVACAANQITVQSSTDLYCVTYQANNVKVQKATVSSESSSINLKIAAQEDSSILLVIPRSILDSQSSSGDNPFVVLADGQPVLDVYEAHSDGSSRTLEISIPDYAGNLEIIGTYAVPEFGAITAVILAIAIVSIIAISARTKLAMPKY
ncbi:PEFG-CTERM sorting domain-containing protein [Candidatus Nitrosotenuis uzonensis]|uniref:PEFG-CTERM sorting domain-containing protein n=1 Tax=Candidatus Nitrosotenuis uzonensis TaxID=1407055 RepID=A0A812F4K5_9ARCH|nr:PEFG-CTERM sorting domain-containing protein [Candidatus Nitrosotenuis uzonensis]CAE6487864.1 conserved exported hypothetical protein [Candidatus Nitrosotenuis uzonensis]